MSCPCEKHDMKADKCNANTPPVLEVHSEECPVLFHTVNISAEQGSVDTLPPTPGAYKNTRVYYEADEIAYLYDSDGIPQLLSGGTGGGAVESVNGKIGAVILDAADVGAQPTLTAGTGISIDSDNVISSDTQTFFYANVSESGTQRHIYKNPDMTGEVSVQELLDANEEGQVILRMSTSATPEYFNDAYLQNTYVGNADYQFLFLDNKVYYEYDGTLVTDTLYYYSTSTIQLQMSAGANVQITGNTISATDTTYSNFVGTDGVDAGAAGLVPAPATTDAGKFLKADGTWDTAGSSITLYTTYGSAEDGAMTQKATTGLVYTAADPKKINIGDNGATGGTNSIIIGSEDSGTITGAADQIIIGHNATDGGQADTIIIGHGSGPTGSTSGGSSISIGNVAKAYSNSVAIGHSSTALDTSVAIGQSSGSSTYGGIAIGYYAVPKGSDGIAIGRTANAGSNAIAIGNSVNTAGTTSTSSVAIGYNAFTPKGSSQGYGDNKVAIGNHAYSRGQYAVSLGYNSAAGTNANANTNTGQTALGHEATATGRSSVAIGEGSRAELQGEFNISATNSNGYNSTNYRLITGVHDGQNAHDAATVAQGNTLSTSAPTTSTAGVLGQLYTDTANMHTYQCTAIDTTDPSNPSYTWTQRW